jgi:LmbE family N-acetylglucosaminyl deacetylase
MTRDRVLVVAAHPDDEILGCGGTLSRLIREGCEVHVAILGEGVTARCGRSGEAERARVEALHAVSKTISEEMGVEECHLSNLPDNRFDTVPLLEVIRTIEALVDRVRPQIIYTHHQGDLNIDHTIVNRAVLTASRPLAGCPIRDIYAFEVPSSTEWAFSRPGSTFAPNVFVDITETIEDKIQALLRYENEVRPFPHPRSPGAIRAIAWRWGSVAGVDAAEAFELIRSLK